ncbi:MAG: acyl-[acyl-carrier-protein] thioesterase [Eubacterium sp.]|nr:acyl-[acyl-carrier-protein] thioesterase [Eubacterium sp.]
MYEFDSRVRYSELAEDKKLSLVSIINYFQDCCTFEAEERGVGLKNHDINHTAWMLINWHIKINRRPEYTERIHVKTWACGFRHFLGDRNFTVKNDEGELLIYAFSRWAFVNTELGAPEKTIPQTEIDAYGISEPLKADFQKGRIQIPDGMTATEPITVTAGNLDTNHHVNNAEYMELAMSAISSYLTSKSGIKNGQSDEAAEPEKSGIFTGELSLNNVKEIRAEYKLQSVLGDVIYPFVSAEGNVITAVLKDGEGNLKLIVELVC